MKDEDKSNQQLLAEIDQLRQQVQTLEASSKTFQAILDKAPILISAKDLQGNVILANQRCNVVENVCNKQFLGNNIYDLFPPKIADAIWKNDLLALSTNDLVEVEEAIIHNDKTKHVYFTVTFALTEENDNPFAVASLSYDITEIKHSLELGITDELTGLYSRRYFNMRFSGELHRASRSQSIFALLLMDIDHLDEYREYYGENRATDVIATLANTIQNVCSREDDLNFRLGENRMACMLSVNDFKAAQLVGEEIRHFIESLSIEHTTAKPHEVVTISMGIAIIHFEDGLDQQTICEITQQALEKSQAHGGNLICLAKKPNA